MAAAEKLSLASVVDRYSGHVRSRRTRISSCANVEAGLTMLFCCYLLGGRNLRSREGEAIKLFLCHVAVGR
jgi:hypothetical protein